MVTYEEYVAALKQLCKVANNVSIVIQDSTWEVFQQLYNKLPQHQKIIEIVDKYITENELDPVLELSCLNISFSSSDNN